MRTAALVRAEDEKRVLIQRKSVIDDIFMV